MALRKLSLDMISGEDKEDDRIQEKVNNKISQTAQVFLPPGYTKGDIPDASPIPSQSLRENLFVTRQSPAGNHAVEEVSRSPMAAHPTTAEARTIEEDESEKYNMQHKRRGVALIFNHEIFEESGLRKREGAEKDGLALEEVLQALSFEVRSYKDLTATALKKTLRDVSLEDHHDADCLFVAVMTHGEKGGFIHAKDNPLTVADVWQPFTADRAISLAGKPKIFLIQACRGSSVEEAVWMSDSTDSLAAESAFSIPTRADFLFAHSSMEGFYSWRNPDSGSWFVQDFCKEIKENGRRRDLLTILTLTLRRVAFNRTSCTPNRRDLHKKKQMPVFSSTLTKLVYFDSTAV